MINYDNLVDPESFKLYSISHAVEIKRQIKVSTKCVCKEIDFGSVLFYANNQCFVTRIKVNVNFKVPSYWFHL